MIKTSAPAKIILCGEHAVVYCRPAIALPLGDVRAYAEASSSAQGSGLRFAAPDLGESWAPADDPQHPMSELAAATLASLGAPEPDLTITLRSDIPIASGMGSGAAIGVALVRALAAAAGRELAPAEVSALVYASEARYHGTPSGIDNTVIAYERAVWFQRRPPERPRIEGVAIGAPLTLVVGDTGVRSATHLPVGAVRARWQADPAAYEALFDAVAEQVLRVRDALAAGDLAGLGAAMDANQVLLAQIGVSSPELERLVGAARAAGAPGAKLSGAGWGGVMIALAPPGGHTAIADALRDAGAARVRVASVAAQSPDR
ncbi:mevalonate kinase [Oscillochloris sp. ZM17-4]|uniref:mevalonate kinase n=1 Tax=Oscillochloris sp. ZM17-4 TaxID=2866714 RepID=UPI001C73BE3A|nr:mevalonate kinase [Oscillochloris sp. ZM17-4]MBX0327821.1 mevalonate kinase [Oscillochloris sp. ZM17-4]